ncbi:hypothetical protein HPB52_005712 [Rhipicephalus sanguineus]|uniref:Protein hook n=1 Tax=Rhipicephalus sanguineus TaxID=34632 RepID=A0A9D4PCB6_RHISA|nr:hypothetical protein HPB52_005712 [Rhipicephalus sanguineus]
MNSITDSLISWLQTFNVSAPHKTVDQLSDGVALAQVLHKIDPDFFDSSWLSKVKTDVGSNWRLKFSNLKKILKAIIDYYNELITKESPSSYTGDNFDLNEQLKKALDELHATAQAKEQITQRCHELDMQVTMLQDEKVSLMQENEKLMEKLNHVENLEDPSTPAGRRYQQSQQRIDALQAEVFKLETAKDELRIKVEFQEKEILNLQEKNEELHKTLNEAQTLKDELDVLRHTSDKVEHYEAAIETYKKKLEDMSDLKRQLKLLEEKNTSYMQTNIELEEDVKKMAAFKSQADLYKKQTQELRLQLADETRKANRAEFEAKKLHEKLASLQTEKESGAKAVGAISDSDMLETVPPEIKEKLIRLQHENKMLKLERSSSEGQQVTLLKTMLEDAQSRQNDLETEVSWCRHRAAEAEGKPQLPHTYNLPIKVVEALRPVYQRLSDPQLQARCRGNKTQNAAESLHSVIWSLISKQQHASHFTVDVAVHEAVARLLSQRNLELESQLEDSREAASAHEGAEARQQLALAQRRCKELEGQLREREASLEAMATRLAESCESQSELTEQLEKKAEETRVMEERYQKYLEKAKNVIRTLDTRSPSSAEVVALRNQLQDKAKHISQLQQELEMFKAQWEKEERLISTAFYNFGAKSQQRSAEERIVHLTGGQSFLARQRQATSKRHNVPGVQTRTRTQH